MTNDFLRELDSELTPFLSEAQAWLKKKDVVCFEASESLVYGQLFILALKDPPMLQPAGFFFASERNVTQRQQLTNHALLDFAFKDRILTQFSAELGEEVASWSPKQIEILLWRGLHQVLKKPAVIQFERSSSVVSGHDEVNYWYLNSDAFAIIHPNPHMQEIQMFRPATYGSRFLTHYRTEYPFGYKERAKKVNYYLAPGQTQTGDRVLINSDYHRLNELNPQFKILVDPLVGLLENSGVQSEVHCLTVTWLIHCLRLHEPQVALEVIGPSDLTQSFANQLSRYMNDAGYGASLEESAILDTQTLTKMAFDAHLVNLGQQTAISEEVQAQLVAILDGTELELMHFDFPTSPKMPMRRPLIWTCEKSLGTSSALHHRTVSIVLSNQHRRHFGDESALHIGSMVALIRMSGYAMTMDPTRAQKTSPDVPDPLKSFDRLGNYLSPNYFGEGRQPYTSFGYEMDAYLPELQYAQQSSHDFY